jgi:hypothetical protein
LFIYYIDMSSNSALLSNSMSPLINSVEVKAGYENFRYKLLAGVGACSKQRRTVSFSPVFGGTNSINLLKYGLCQQIYLKVAIRDGNAADDMVLAQAGVIAAIDELTLSSHSKILERLDRIAIMKYVLDKAKSEQDNIFALTGYNSLTAGDIVDDADHIVYIPLPFSFFGSMDKAKDLLHLQQLTVNVKWASQSDVAHLISAGTATSWVYSDCELVINYLELPSAKLNELWNQNYSANKPTNQLLLTTFKENEKSITVSSSEQDFAIDLTTKGCVVKSYICIRPDPASHASEKRTNFKDIEKIVFKCNGQSFYAARSDELEFERCIMGDNYNSMSAGKNDRTNYTAIYEFDFSVIPAVHAHKKYSQAISFKNLSAPQYVITAKHASLTAFIVEVVHVQLNLVAFSKQDGSMESILSV